jgi:spore coat polysaccharide biosynthesis protein SpsF (cytidylyltransferase family)
MIRTLGIIDAYSPGEPSLSCSLEGLVHSRVHGQSLVSWIAGRVLQAQRLDRVVVAANPRIATELQRLTPSYASIYPSSASDALKMLVDVTDWYPAQGIIRVGLDNPFVDPELIDRLVVAAEQRPDCDYLSYQLHDGRPVMLSRMGVCAEWYRVSALITADREIKAFSERNRVTQCLCRRPEMFRVGLIPMPNDWPAGDVHLAIDNTYDLEVLDEIIDALGPDRIDIRHLAELLGQHPSLQHRILENASSHGE